MAAKRDLPFTANALRRFCEVDTWRQKNPPLWGYDRMKEPGETSAFLLPVGQGKMAMYNSLDICAKMSRSLYICQLEGVMSGTSYKSRLRGAIAFALVGTLAIGFVGGRLVRMVEPGQHFWLVLPLLLLVAVAMMLVPMPWWNRLDDLQKQGQLNSWYWGGMAGGLAVLMWIIAATGHDSPVTKGAVALFVGQGAGFLLAYAIWWWRGRGPVE